MTLSATPEKAKVQKPASIKEACEIITEARNYSHVIIPTGNGTKMALGYPCKRSAVHLDTKALDKVIDYPARDMTITVQAGITMQNLRVLLAKENQRLPVDDPYQGASTLGGMIATNTSGPRRFGWGTLRDYVIGISILNDEGMETKAGGRVVKNVAGYDFCKLHTGALGTLGVISQVTLKVRPVSEANALVLVGLNPNEVESALNLVHQTSTRPVVVDILNPKAADQFGLGSGDKWLLAVGFEHSKTTTDWQVQTIAREFQDFSSSTVEVLEGSNSEKGWKALESFQGQPQFDSPVTFKANIPPAKVATWSELANQLFPEAFLQAHAGNGIVFGHIQGLDLNDTKNGLNQLMEKAVRYQGNMVLHRCPDSWKEELPLWGTLREDLELMRKVKQAMDPLGLFNPGRFVGRI